MKKLLKISFMFIIMFCFCLIAKADLHDYSGGGSGNTGSLGSGSWSTGYVGIKVSIVNSSNQVEDVEIFLNSSGKGSTNFSYENLPKTHQSTSITWTSSGSRTTYTASFLPSKWKDSDNNTINLYNILTENNYENLKSLVNHSSLSGSVGTGDYIYIEPMVKIGNNYGTAFEMTNAFLDNSNCGKSGTFCYSYSSAVFGGNSSNKRGVLYTTLYVSTNINGVNASDGSTRNERNNCLKSSTCGRGIGIFKYDDIYPQGKVKITIYDNVTKNVITNPNRQATYKIYSGSNCNGTAIGGNVTTSSGSKTVNLAPGTYSIKEITHPKDYVASSNKCVKTSISISTGNTTPADIYYEPTCEVELETSNKTVNSLMTLYNKYKKRGLLNFSTPSCNNNKDDLCKEDKLKNNKLNCLSGSNILKSIFDQNNLSCYDEIVTSDSGSIGFCSTNFSLTNKLGTNTFSGYGGQFLIKKQALESITTAKTSRTCYIYNKNLYSSYKNIASNKVFFGDNNNDGITDELKEYEDKETYNLNGQDVNAYFKKYVYEKTKNYYLNPVYLEKFTGKYSVNKTNNTTQEPIYGVIANFKKEDSYIPFKLVYGSKTYNSEDCTYNTEERIITYEEKENGRLDLEFRIIDINEPFNRDTNSNWCDENGNCGKDNDIVKKIIKERNNSYNSENVANPIYKIKLTPSDIKIIKKYNEDNKYSYYQMIINDDDEFVNSFVHDLKLGEIKKYKENGNVEKTYGVLSNKLIVN